MASTMLHPVQFIMSTFPLAEHNDHLLNITCHVSQILTAVACFHFNFTTLLCESNSIANEFFVSLVELSFYMEWNFSIDPVLRTWAIGSIWTNMDHIKRALATIVTIIEDTIGSRCITFMTR